MSYYLEVSGKSMDEGQRDFLKSLAECVEGKFEAPIIVNVGVLLGCSMVCFRAGSSGARLIGVDRNLKSRYPGKRAREFLRAEFIEEDSHEVGEAFEGPVHLLFVDGGHAYGTVKRDIESWVPKIVEGGIVCFHDCHMGPVLKAVDEWRNSWKVPWLEIPGPCPGVKSFERTK